MVWGSSPPPRPRKTSSSPHLPSSQPQASQRSPGEAQGAWFPALAPRVNRVLPRPDSQTTPFQCHRKEASPGWGHGEEGPLENLWCWSFLLLPMVFLAQIQAPLKAAAGSVPTLHSGTQLHHLHPQGPCPTQGQWGLGLVPPPVLDGLTFTSAALPTSTPSQGHISRRQKGRGTPSKKEL